jgi:hypothetical protein
VSKDRKSKYRKCCILYETARKFPILHIPLVYVGETKEDVGFGIVVECKNNENR